MATQPSEADPGDAALQLVSELEHALIEERRAQDRLLKAIAAADREGARQRRALTG